MRDALGSELQVDDVVFVGRQLVSDGPIVLMLAGVLEASAEGARVLPFAPLDPAVLSGELVVSPEMVIAVRSLPTDALRAEIVRREADSVERDAELDATDTQQKPKPCPHPMSDGGPCFDRCPRCGDCRHDISDGIKPCCNPKCGGRWGIGCFHCHHSSYAERSA